MSARYTTLVGAAELAPRLGAPDWVLVDCRYTLSDPAAGATAYNKSRLPGARYADLERALSAPRRAGGGRNPLPSAEALAASFARWGITPHSQVVVYDDSFGSIACRLWFLLRYAGHRQVALLDGGWPAWKRARLPIDEAPPGAMTTAEAPPYPVTLNPALLADTAEVERIRCDPGWALLDARPEERFTGEREPVDPVGGHIPGSRNWTFEDNLALDGRLLDAAELRANFAGLLGPVPPTHVVHTCGSGVTACHNLLAMEHAGLTGSRLYAGSWSEWIGDPARPVATGAD